MSDTKLLPCPFCGKSPKQKFGGDLYGWVECRCGVRTPLFTHEQAIAAWNTRVPDPRIKPGRKMQATHFVAGTDGPVSCDSVDNLLRLANKRIAKLETTDPRIAAAQSLADALKYPRFGDTAQLFEKCVEMLRQRDEKLLELTGENWTSLYLHHFSNAITTMRAALAAWEKLK